MAIPPSAGPVSPRSAGLDRSGIARPPTSTRAEQADAPGNYAEVIGEIDLGVVSSVRFERLWEPESIIARPGRTFMRNGGLKCSSATAWITFLSSLHSTCGRF